MFRREAVIERKRAGLGARRQWEYQRPVRSRRAEVVTAAVQIEDGGRWRLCRRRERLRRLDGFDRFDRFEPFAAQRHIAWTVAFVQRPAARHPRRPDALRRLRTGTLDADCRSERLRTELPAQNPARECILPAHRDGLREDKPSWYVRFPMRRWTAGSNRHRAMPSRHPLCFRGQGRISWPAIPARESRRQGSAPCGC